MALTTEQKQTLKTYILNTPELEAQPNTADGAFAIAAALNTEASPAFYVWRSSVTRREIMQNGFDWVLVDNLSVGKARIWEWLFADTGAFVPSKPNVRAAIDECWKGTAAMLTQRANIYNHCQRKATVAEKLFATGAGTSVVDGLGPATMSFEGSISYQDVDAARNS